VITKNRDVNGVTGDTLRAIVDTLDTLCASSMDITEFKVNGVTVGVRRRDDQRNGTYYVVTSITSVTGGLGKFPVYRSNENDVAPQQS
jgi:hypothetical protein